MEVSAEMRAAIFETIDNQIKSNDPPETKITFDRLVTMGIPEFETKQLIGQCLITEMLSIVKEQRPFDESRFIDLLRQLPKSPIE